MRRDAPIVLVAVDLTERLWIPAPAKCGRRVLARGQTVLSVADHFFTRVPGVV